MQRQAALAQPPRRCAPAPTVAQRARTRVETAATVRDLAPTTTSLADRRTDEWILAVASGHAPFGTTRSHFHKVNDAVLAEAATLKARTFPEREHQALVHALLHHESPGQLDGADLLRLVQHAAPTLTQHLTAPALAATVTALVERLR